MVFITSLIFAADCIIALLLGVRDAYAIYDAASWTAAWLVLLHFIRSRGGRALIAYLRRHLSAGGSRKQH